MMFIDGEETVVGDAAAPEEVAPATEEVVTPEVDPEAPSDSEGLL